MEDEDAWCSGSGTVQMGNVRLHRQIGRALSSTSTVFVGEFGAKPAAIRVLCLDRLDRRQLARVEHEVSMMTALRHPNVVHMLGVTLHGSRLLLCTALLPYGSARDVIHAKFAFGLPEAVVGHTVKGALLALQYLHSKGIIHRAVRASHLLISANAKSHNVCLTGLRHSLALHGRDRVHDFDDDMRTNVLWCSPEMLRQDLRGYTTSTDIYSLGCAIAEMCNTFPPFHEQSPMLMLLHKLDALHPCLLDQSTLALHSERDGNALLTHLSEKTLSAELHDMASVALTSDPKLRPTATEMLKHPFLHGPRMKSSLYTALGAGLSPLSLKPSNSKCDIVHGDSLYHDTEWVH